MTEENTRGFVARLQAKSVVDRSFMERKYIEAAERVKKKNETE